jgi:hypothetical protein
MNGMIHGGWNFVIAAYGFTGAALLTYLGSVVWRLRDESRAGAVAREARRLEAEALLPNPRPGALS